jgi:hypothetical protein
VAEPPLAPVSSEEKQNLERIDEPDMLELGGRRERLGGVAAVECVAEAVIRGTLRRHERMFACICG